MNFSVYLSTHSGEVAALSSAVLWACSTVLYSQVGRFIRPIRLNLYKNLIGILLLSISLLVSVIVVNGRTLTGATPLAVILLMSSGILGIGIGDTAYFEAMKCLGVRKASLMKMLSPLASSLLALIFLQENLKLAAWLGIGLTLLGVAWVVAERPESNGAHDVHWGRGIAFGVAAALAEGSGAVLTHKAMSGSSIDPLWGTFIRIAGATAILLIVTRWVWRPENPTAVQTPRSIWWKMLVAIFLGSFIGILFQQFALKFTQAGIAQTLFATTPLYVLIIVIILGERPNLRAGVGLLVAIMGIGMLFGLN